MSEQNRRRRQEIRSLDRRKAEIMTAVVTDDDPLTISVRGGAPVPATSQGASPSVDDVVIVALSGARYFVLGGGGGGITLPIEISDVDGLSTALQPYAESVGDGINTSFTVTHGLGTKDVHVSVLETSTGAEGLPTITRPTTNTVVVSFASAPSSNQYRVVIS